MSNLYRSSIMLGSVLLLVGCHKKPAYPGYTPVSTFNGTMYYVDSSTIARAPGSGTNVISMAELIQNPNRTHTMGQLFTNCSSMKSVLEESTTFDETGKVISSDKARNQDEPKVAQFLCSKSTSLPLFSGAFDRKAALVVFLGLQNNEWIPHFPSGFENSFFGDAGQPVSASVILEKEYSEGGKGKHLLVLSSVPAGDYSCHACWTLISAVIFRQEPNGWFEDSGNEYLTVSGAFGSPPKAGFSQMGPDRYGFNLALPYMGQGEEIDSEEFFATTGKTITSILEVETLHSTPGFRDTPDTSSSTTVEWQPQVTNGFYDVHLVSRGSKLSDSSAVVPVIPSQICKMTAAKYECK